ncbi:uncharacterized protein G2W53_021621 [Senna tora]|uniref:Uncharacterized protein n=1 Tax=Senna tora TaxID=362788 RepID=A0A834WI16_9FABA|nr:uncharacterized protein G2W53_021621 [Senna tora]
MIGDEMSDGREKIADDEIPSAREEEEREMRRVKEHIHTSEAPFSRGMEYINIFSLMEGTGGFGDRSLIL